MQTRIRRDYFKHAEFPRFSFCICHLAARFFENKILRCEVPHLTTQGNYPISLARSYVTCVGWTAKSTEHHFIAFGNLNQITEKTSCPHTQSCIVHTER